MKRVFDIVVSCLGLLVLFFPMLIVCMLIKLLMPGPVLFIQERVGKNRKIFKLYKFRTMKIKMNSEKGSFDPGDKSRITPLGALLRKFKIDELPQLINVFKGDMSFVGPRPEVYSWTTVYPDVWDKVLTVRPGITDNASIYFRDEETILANSSNPTHTYKHEILPKKLKFNIDYVNNISIYSDLIIILKTLKAIILK